MRITNRSTFLLSRRATIANDTKLAEECGIDVPLIEGGYKALRRFLIDGLESALRDLNIVVVAGRTGVAKTAMPTNAVNRRNSQRLISRV